jgi:hypothetical protein
MINPGTLPIAGFFEESDANGQIAMLTDMNAKTTRQAIITLPDSIATWTFNAFITKWKIGEAGMDGAIPFTAELQITGKPVFAVTTSTGLTTPFFAISNSAVINPAPAGNVYTYVATVLTAVASVTVTPTASAGTITVQGNTVASGVASSAVTLGSAGSVTPITIVVTETGKAPKTYTIYLSRA